MAANMRSLKKVSDLNGMYVVILCFTFIHQIVQEVLRCHSNSEHAKPYDVNFVNLAYDNVFWTFRYGHGQNWFKVDG